MSQWHREHPELAGTDSDPWMRNPSYAQAMRDAELECHECGKWRRGVEDGLCPICRETV